MFLEMLPILLGLKLSPSCLMSTPQDALPLAVRVSESFPRSQLPSKQQLGNDKGRERNAKQKQGAEPKHTLNNINQRENQREDMALKPKKFITSKGGGSQSFPE